MSDLSQHESLIEHLDDLRFYSAIIVDQFIFDHQPGLAEILQKELKGVVQAKLALMTAGTADSPAPITFPIKSGLLNTLINNEIPKAMFNMINRETSKTALAQAETRSAKQLSHQYALLAVGVVLFQHGLTGATIHKSDLESFSANFAVIENESDGFSVTVVSKDS